MGTVFSQGVGNMLAVVDVCIPVAHREGLLLVDGLVGVWCGGWVVRVTRSRVSIQRDLRRVY